MPTVPYSPIPTATPSERGTPNLSVQTPSAAFGGVVGQALEGLGKQIEHSGDEIFKRAIALQDLKNETDAKEADAQYMMDVGNLHAQFSSLEGKNAVTAYPKYMQDIQDLRQQRRDSLPNDMARKMYDSSSLSVMSRTIFNGAGHAATQMKIAANGAADARIDASLNNILANPNDDVNFRRLENGIIHEIHSKADLHGWDKAQTDDQVTKVVSKAIAHRIVGLSKTEPFKAEKMLEENDAKLHWEDKERVENTVRTQLRNTGARNISDEVNADLTKPVEEGKPEASLQDRIQRGIAKAKELAPKDDLLPDIVRDRITADFNKRKAVDRDFEYTNRNIIEGAIVGGPNGKMPTTVEELKADPKAAAAYDALDNKWKLHYNKALAANAKGDQAWSAEGLRQYRTLKGMASGDDTARTEFLDRDIVSEKLPNSAKRELINLQQRLKNKADDDPRVNRAMSILGPTLGAAGVDRTKDKDGYDHFRGALQDALDLFQQEHKKGPNFKEVQEIGARLLQEQIDPNKWSFGFMNRTSPLFEQKPPDDIIEKIKTDPKWKEIGLEPTDEQIRRIYVRDLIKKLYSGEKKKP